MLIKKGKPFNLWSTNGRRADILNALDIYLNILDDLDREYPSEIWGRYPVSIKQYEFYKRAIIASPEVFEEHSTFDELSVLIEANRAAFDQKDQETAQHIGIFPYRIQENIIYKNYDTNIENRARQYTSNLVRIGFADANRNISPAGREFMSRRITKDSLEAIFPLDDINIILLRQLLKLRVFTKEENGE